MFCFKYKTFDKRTKLYKAIEKHASVFESKKLYENKIPDWINQYIIDKGYKIKPKAAQLMTDCLGTDLSRIANECDKLFLNLKPNQEIDTSHIEQYIGISKEFNSFELNAALANKNVSKAYRIINHFKANPKTNPMPVTMGSLYSYFSKVLLYHSLPDKSQNAAANALGVSPFVMTDYIVGATNSAKKIASVVELLHECDVRSKGVNNSSADDGELLKELVFKILH